MMVQFQKLEIEGEDTGLRVVEESRKRSVEFQYCHIEYELPVRAEKLISS